MIRLASLAVCVAVVVAAIPSTASARQDAITIREGSIVWGSNPVILDLKGTRSFRLSGIFVGNGSVHGEYLSCLVCFPGDTVQFGRHFGGVSEFGADVTFRGSLYPNVNNPFVEEDGHWAVIETSGSLTLPTGTADTALVVAPFQLRGGFQVTDASGKVSQFALTGQGQASFFFVREPYYQSWYMQRVELDIERGPSR